MNARRPYIIAASLLFLFACAIYLNGEINDHAEAGWLDHPALIPPDGRSHRGGKIVAANIRDPRILAELSRRFRDTKRKRGRGAFEIEQEYLLRLLDYYVFEKERMIGLERSEIERIFGPSDSVRGYTVNAGRDHLSVYFNGARCTRAIYVMGF